MTQSERRGAVLRAQADAALEFKFVAGQAQDESAYAGVLTCVCTPLHSHHFGSAEGGQPDKDRMHSHPHRPPKALFHLTCAVPGASMSMLAAAVIPPQTLHPLLAQHIMVAD